MGHHAGDEDLAHGQLDRLPHCPLMGVVRVGRLEGVGPGPDAQHNVNDIFQRHVGRVWAVPAAPAHMVANAVLGQTRQGLIEGLHPTHGKGAIVRQGGLRVRRIVLRHQARIVDLQDEARVDDGLILVLHGVGDSGEVIVRAWVILIAALQLDGAGSHGRDEGLFHLHLAEGRLEVGDIGLDCCFPDIRNGASADRCDAGPRASLTGVIFLPGKTTLLWHRWERIPSSGFASAR